MAALIAAVFLFTGCGAGSGENSASPEIDAKAGSARESGPAPNAGPAPGAAERAATEYDAQSDSQQQRDAGTAPVKNSPRVVPALRDMVYKGKVTVRVKSVEAATTRAEQITVAAGGVVHAEETSTDGPAGTSRAHLTLRVPPSEFRSVMDSLSDDLGKGLRKSQTAEDVTTQIVDTASRIETQRTSISRVRALLNKATSLDTILRLESEVAQRESDLESLEAQLARLKDLAAEATIELELVEEKAKVAAKPKKDAEPETGFLVGFRGGWNAFVEIVLVGLTVVGALLPFAITLGLLGVPIWWLTRSRLRRRSVAPEAPAI